MLGSQNEMKKDRVGVNELKNRRRHSGEKEAENDRALARPCPTEKSPNR